MNLRAVTFDFWQTLFTDRGFDFEELLAERVRMIRDAALKAGVDATFEEVESAWRACHLEYQATWQQGGHYPNLKRVAGTLARVGAALPPARLEELTARVEERTVEKPPEPLPGAIDTIKALHGRYRLAIISDTGVTPGRVLRRFIARAGILEAFATTTFSDEVGRSKPTPEIFRLTLHALNAAPAEAAHVGDLRRTDVAGGRAVGMRTVRYRGHKDDPTDLPDADAVIAHHQELPGVLERWT
jgi:putative hydrolase of the HAD superfamily